MYQNKIKFFFLVPASAMGIAGIASCSAADEPPSSKVESPAEHRRAQLPAPSSSADTNRSPSPHTTETGLSQLDQSIAEAWPPRAWSKNVPAGACTSDTECGDGFCDRGQCAAIWTWTEFYGQKCESLRLYHSRLCPTHGAGASAERRCDLMPPCGSQYLCIEGRCRSCVSNAECLFNGGGFCFDGHNNPHARWCGIPGAPTPVNSPSL